MAGNGQFTYAGPELLRDESTEPDYTPLLPYLASHQQGARFLVGVSSSVEAAPLILASGQAVLTLGGYTGASPTLSVGDLERLVQRHEIRYFIIAPGGGGRWGHWGRTDELVAWVRDNGNPVTDAPDVSDAELYEVEP